MFPFIAFFKSVLRNDLGRSAKGHDLNIGTDAVLYEEQSDRSKDEG